MTLKPLFVLIIAALYGASGYSNAYAQTDDTSATLSVVPAPTDQALWELHFAGFSRYGASYPASTESQTNVVPLPFPVYRGTFLRIGDETEKPVRTRIFRRDRIKLDFDFGLNFPVDSDDIDVRAGMPDLDLLLEAGPELELQFKKPVLGGDTYLALQARGAMSFDGVDPDWRGFIYSVELKHKRPIWTPGTELVTRLTPEFASEDYMDFFYGVDAVHAAPGRPAYRAKSGYLGTRLSFVLKHQLSDTVEVLTGLRLGFYQGAANDNSPLYTKETTNGVYAAILWKFWESKRRSRD